MSPERIPLFPLNIVLFPGQAMPLHIFERRYRAMTRHCIDTNSPFGIVLFQEGNLARTGCSALIVKTLKEYEDGRSDILTAGQRAFQLIRTHEEQPYIEGDVEYLDEDFTGTDARVSARLEQLFNQCHRLLFEQADAPPFETEEAFRWRTTSPPNCRSTWRCVRNFSNCGRNPSGKIDCSSGSPSGIRNCKIANVPGAKHRATVTVSCKHPAAGTATTTHAIVRRSLQQFPMWHIMESENDSGDSDDHETRHTRRIENASGIRTRSGSPHRQG